MEYKTVSLADQIYERLENDIITGVYPRGEVLTEMKLVEQLGVSRTPIREALRRLEQERLIQDCPKGSLVLGITLEDLEDIMNIRQRIEGLAAYHATKNLTPESAEKFKQISDLQDFYYSKQDMDKLREMDDAFHEAIYELSGRTVIRDTLRPLHHKTQRYRRISMSHPTRVAATMQEHRAMCTAILSGNAELAAQLTEQHIENAKIHMMAGCK